MNYADFNAWIFDLDGTLVDSMAGVVECMKVTARETGGEVTDEVELRASFGRGLMNTLKPWIPEHRLDEAIERYQRNFPVYVQPAVHWMPGARELLDRVRALGKPMGIVTGNKVFEARGLFEALSLGDYFSFERVICADSIPFQKPSPEPVLECVKKMGVFGSKFVPILEDAHDRTPISNARSDADLIKRVVFVGDSEHDVRAGRLAGAYTVAVLGGSSPKDRLLAARPDEVFDDLFGVFRKLSSCVPG